MVEWVTREAAYGLQLLVESTVEGLSTRDAEKRVTAVAVVNRLSHLGDVELHHAGSVLVQKSCPGDSALAFADEDRLSLEVKVLVELA